MRIKLNIPIRIEEIESILGRLNRAFDTPDHTITHISTDSRICEKGDLFFAIRGAKFDGNDFTEEALRKGCLCVADNSTLSHIKVSDTTDSLLTLATYYKTRLRTLKKTIAITGSVGKSSTKEFLKRIVSGTFVTHANVENYNNAIGLAHTIFTMPITTECLICELGMNHLGEIERMSKCIAPDVGIITSIGTSHLGNLGSREAIAKAKSEITCGMTNGFTIIPYNEPLLFELNNSIKTAYNAETSLSQFTLQKRSYQLYDYVHPNGIIQNLSIKLSGDHMLSNISKAIAASLLLNISEDKIRIGAASIKESDLRQRFIRTCDYTIFDDSYNASYESIAADLIYLRERFPHSRIGAFLGDIAELGDMSESIHTDIGRLIPQFNVCNLYLIGSYANYVAKGAIDAGFDESHVFINERLCDHDLSIKQIAENHLSGEIILFKGSHSSRLYEIADAISKKGRYKND